MANRIPLATNPLAAGGYLLPYEQGDILTKGMLQEAGAIALAGDSRATSTQRTQFSVWLGEPTAGPVGEGAKKPVTGAEFGQAELNVKKFASIVLFTDEMLEDVQGGDLNVLVDSGVRRAINVVIDAHAVGIDAGTEIDTVFDSQLRDTEQTVEYDPAVPDGLQLAISAAMGLLEGNGYGDVGNMGALLGFGFAQALRDARSTLDPSMPIFGAGTGRDPLYGISSFMSTNLPPYSGDVGDSDILGFVVYRPNLHVRIRRDVTLSTSTEATIFDGRDDRQLFQEDLTAVRYETRLAFFIHDINRSVVAITRGAGRRRSARSSGKTETAAAAA